MSIDVLALFKRLAAQNRVEPIVNAESGRRAAVAAKHKEIWQPLIDYIKEIANDNVPEGITLDITTEVGKSFGKYNFSIRIKASSPTDDRFHGTNISLHASEPNKIGLCTAFLHLSTNPYFLNITNHNRRDHVTPTNQLLYARDMEKAKAIVKEIMDIQIAYDFDVTQMPNMEITEKVSLG